MAVNDASTRLAGELVCQRLGQVEYADGLELMRQWVEARAAGTVPDTLFLLQHPPVITLGRGATAKNIVATPERLEREGVSVFETDRGGDVTYHGPGQVVGYPLFLLPPSRQDVRRYVRDVEECLIRALAHFGISAHRESRWPGVWVRLPNQGLLKIAAIGVHISRWMTRHGFALNVNTHLPHFDLIVPCGITEAGVTSLSALLGHPVPLEEVEVQLEKAFGEVFEANVRRKGPELRTVSVSIFDGPEKVLLLRRRPSRGGFWQIITGVMLEGESPREAALREVREETGTEARVQSLDYAHAFVLGQASPPVVCHETAFGARWPGGVPVLNEEEHEAFEWTSVPEALSRLPHEGLRVALRKAQKMLF